mgnify:CR=1 FL=1
MSKQANTLELITEEDMVEFNEDISLQTLQNARLKKIREIEEKIELLEKKYKRSDDKS